MTPILIVCANTLGAALPEAEHGVTAHRTFRFRHTSNLQAKFAEARHVLGMTINYQKQFKQLADRMAAEPIAEWALERRVLRHLWTIDDEMGNVARRDEALDRVRALDAPPLPRGLTSGLTPRPDRPLYRNNVERGRKLLPPTRLRHGHLSPAARRMGRTAFVEELMQSLEGCIRELNGEIASLRDARTALTSDGSAVRGSPAQVKRSAQASGSPQAGEDKAGPRG